MNLNLMDSEAHCSRRRCDCHDDLEKQTVLLRALQGLGPDSLATRKL
jgi:hypothetical protein